MQIKLTCFAQRLIFNQRQMTTQKWSIEKASLWIYILGIFILYLIYIFVCGFFLGMFNHQLP